VLPFVNMSSDPEQEYFSDGLSEELLNQLAQIEDLHVAGRSSSFSFKGKYEDLRVIGERLGVGNILEGSVRKAGRQLRITAQLINSRDGTQLWSRTYERELDDVFAIQEEIAIAVSRALSIKLDVGTMSHAKGGTANVDAYDKYLRARALWLGLGVARVLPAVELYREAVALDPQYARAWYALWDALAWAPTTPTTRRDRAEASARAQAISPDSWWSHAMLAHQLIEEREWSGAEAAARAAMAAEPPSEFEAGTMYAYVLSALGREQEVVKYFERARQLEPLSLGLSSILQHCYLLSGRLAEADAEYQRGKTLVGDRTFAETFALLRLWSSKDAKLAEVRAQFRVAVALDNPPYPLNQALVDKLDDEPAARAEIGKAFADPTDQDDAHIESIAWYADHFHDKDLALAALRRQVIDLGGEIGALWASWETGLRSDARFKAIVSELGLVDYWRASGNWGDYCKPVGDDDFECR
jgi:TolB-like protein